MFKSMKLEIYASLLLMFSMCQLVHADISVQEDSQGNQYMASDDASERGRITDTEFVFVHANDQTVTMDVTKHLYIGDVSPAGVFYACKDKMKLISWVRAIQNASHLQTDANVAALNSANNSLVKSCRKFTKTFAVELVEATDAFDNTFVKVKPSKYTFGLTPEEKESVTNSYVTWYNVVGLLATPIIPPNATDMSKYVLDKRHAQEVEQAVIRQVQDVFNAFE